MQGRNENILTVTDKLVAFKKTFAICKNRLKVDDLDMLPSDHKTCLTEMILIISAHLTCLENRIQEYLPSISSKEFYWICNPFLDLSVTNLSNCHLCEEKVVDSS